MTHFVCISNIFLTFKIKQLVLSGDLWSCFCGALSLAVKGSHVFMAGVLQDKTFGRVVGDKVPINLYLLWRHFSV